MAAVKLRRLDLLEGPPPPPRWIAPGLIERGAVTLVSGDTGTSKSLLLGALVVAIVKGGEWIGRPVEQGRVAVVDEEMLADLALARLWALGLRSADGERLAYWCRSGLQIDQHDDLQVLGAALEQHRPDVVILDTALACTGLDANDNPAVAALYRRVLRPLAQTHDAGIVLVHHESKSSARTGRDASLAALGARSWVGQADAQIAVERAPAADLWEAETRDDGTIAECFRIRLRRPKSRMSGDRENVEALTVESTKAPDGALLSMEVRSEGPIDGDRQRGAQTTVVEALVRRVVQSVEQSGGQATTAEIALAVAASGTSLKRALKLAIERGLLHKPGGGRGSYAVGRAA